jgi:Na+-transporting NADH:ubiquinone oxidoreductase subunit C
VNSTNYIVFFILALTASVAVLLTGLREATKGQAARNEEIFNKRAILLAVENYLPEGRRLSDLSDAEVLNLFNERVEQKALNMEGEALESVAAEDVDMAQERKKPESQRTLPLFIYNAEDGERLYILSVRGSGLWDEIWGNIALKSDLNTIAGVAFDHKAETPGLGAEIKDNPSFREQFEGRKIYDDGQYVSVRVRKGGARNKEHEVDGISGATVTADGVSEMLYRGIRYYEPYFQQVRQQSGVLSN